jgi:hypothetical protein
MLVLQLMASGAVIVVSFMLATDPARNLPRKISAIGFGVAAIVWMGRGSERLRAYRSIGGSFARRMARKGF